MEKETFVRKFDKVLIKDGVKYHTRVFIRLRNGGLIPCNDFTMEERKRVTLKIWNNYNSFNVCALHIPLRNIMEVF
jgi:hypothetical protein